MIWNNPEQRPEQGKWIIIENMLWYDEPVYECVKMSDPRITWEETIERTHMRRWSYITE